MRVPGEFPGLLRSGPFTRAQALAAGLSSSRLRSRDIERVGRWVYRWVRPVEPLPSDPAAPADPDAPRAREIERLQQVAARHPDIIVTGASAARLWGWPLPREVAGSPVLTVVRERTRRAIPVDDVVTRRVDLDKVVVRRDRLHGLRIASHPDAWFHLSGTLGRDALVAVGDHLARSRPRRGKAALAGRRLLQTCLERHHGDAGAPEAREALSLVRDGADSPPETELRLALMDAGLPEPELQIELWDPLYSDRYPASADMGYRQWKIALQYEGRQHDGGTQVSRDTRRDAVFQRAGWPRRIGSGASGRPSTWSGQPSRPGVETRTEILCTSDPPRRRNGPQKGHNCTRSCGAGAGASYASASRRSALRSRGAQRVDVAARASARPSERR